MIDLVTFTLFDCWHHHCEPWDNRWFGEPFRTDESYFKKVSFHESHLYKSSQPVNTDHLTQLNVPDFEGLVYRRVFRFGTWSKESWFDLVSRLTEKEQTERTRPYLTTLEGDDEGRVNNYIWGVTWLKVRRLRKIITCIRKRETIP